MSNDSDSMMGVLDVAFLLMIAWDTLPVYQPQQHRPVYLPPPCPPPPSQSYQLLPYTPPVHQLEQHRPVYQPLPLLPPPPPPSQSYRSSPPRPPSPHGPPKHEDINQQDGLHARTNKEGDEMARCFIESREAYSRGDRAAAKVLSKQGKDHKQKMEQLNKEASNRIYLEKNRDRKPGEIDLHGLYVKEAIAYTDAALEEAKLRGDSEIRLIAGHIYLLIHNNPIIIGRTYCNISCNHS
ncbi:uncharacterized protein ARMOST_10303 [Armillaria ostoyae]|uniref:DUF1771 domain-containing protein n=1 Tax=Armillaria ostoyae TaxID=47428 RepID=A0A284RDX5_ARMOS|nr:uncharacterized protein ARMOST_10303 [Armillaria ostoyae]